MQGAAARLSGGSLSMQFQKILRKSFPILQKALLNSTLFKGEEQDCLRQAVMI